MSDKSNKPSHLSDDDLNLLREKAEELINSSDNPLPLIKSKKHQSRDELIEELRTYQAELEVQNDELQQALQQVEQSRAHYLKLFHDNPLPSILFDKKGVILEANKATEALLRVTFPSNRSRSLYYYLEDESGTAIASKLGSCELAHSKRIELKLKLPKQGVFDCVLTKFEPIDSATYMLIMLDITEVKRLFNENEILSKAAANTTSGIAITNAEREVIWVNSAFEKMTGYELSEVFNQSLSKFLQGEKTDKETVEEIRTNLAAGLPIETDILNYRKNGTEYWNDLKITPIFEDGELKYFVGVQHDITEKKEQLETLIRMQRLDMIGHMAAGTAHDFNNILGIISGNLEIAELICEQKELTPYFEKMKKGIERATALTSNLLKSSKRSPMQVANVSILVAMNELKQMLTEVIPKSVTLNWSIDKSVKQQVNLNEIQDSLLNMVVNATNAINHHGTIDVSVRKEATFNELDAYEIASPLDSSSYTVITIKDDGCGIPSEKFDSVFLPFESYSTLKKGTGLGLAMVLGFVNRNKYGLTLKSQVGVGTEFAIWIPASGDKAPLTRKTDTDEIVNEQRKLKILLIDDEVELATITKLSLEKEGHQVTVFNDGEEALEHIISNLQLYDLVITDEIMPGSVQGHEILNKIARKIPAILISGFTDSENIKDYRSNLLTKPFSRDALLSKVKQTMDNSAFTLH